MIVVLGRPGLTSDDGIDRLAGHVAVAAAREGGPVEMVGSVGDDADGDAVVVQLGRAGIGHAAMLRDPAAATPRSTDGADHRLPRLDAGDVDLGLRYLADFSVLVIAEPISQDALRVAVDACAYHGAELVILTAGADGGTAGDSELPESATVLEIPIEDSQAFADVVAQYAVALDSGRAPTDAWRDAVDATGWEQATE